MRSLAVTAALALAIGSANVHGQQPAADDIRVLLAPELETTLVSPMLGRIRNVNVTLGSPVAKGKVVVDFDCQEQAARVAMAQAELVAARENHEAKLRLQALQSAGEVEVNLAAAAVDKARAQLDLYRVQSSQCVVVAPFSGRAVRIHVKPFQGVTAGHAPDLRLNYEGGGGNGHQGDERPGAEEPGGCGAEHRALAQQPGQIVVGLEQRRPDPAGEEGLGLADHPQQQGGEEQGHEQMDQVVGHAADLELLRRRFRPNGRGRVGGRAQITTCLWIVTLKNV